MDYDERARITEYRINIRVDLVSGKSKRKSHYSKEYFVNDEDLGYNTVKLEF